MYYIDIDIIIDNIYACVLSHFSSVHVIATPWTIVHQAPLSMEFYRSGFYFVLQGIFPTQRSNLGIPRLLHWQADTLPLSHQGSPILSFFNLLFFSVSSLIEK